MELSFTGLLAVALVAFGAPLLLGFLPRLRFPSAVLELLAGIVLGPSVLGWVHMDVPIRVLSLIGLSFLLFLAGLEVEFEKLNRLVLRLTGRAYVLSLALAATAGFSLHAVGLLETPLFVGIILSASALGVIVPVLKDAGESASEFGQLVITGASMAEFGSIVLLSLLFSGQGTSTGSRITLLMAFAAMAAVVGVAIARAGRSMRLSEVLLRLQDTSAQIRVRGAVVLLMGFVAISAEFGQEAIFGAFIAGAILSIVDRDAMRTHPQFRTKLEAMGFGLFVPAFWVASGLQFDARALFASFGTVMRVPLFLGILLVVRGLPAMLYRRSIGLRRSTAAALLQATSLTFIVAASQIGQALGKLTPANGAALIGAGLLSVVIFPVTALSLLRERATEPTGELG